MTVLNLHRFSKPETLCSIDKKHLISFLEPYREYLSERGVKLPSVDDEDDPDYSALSNVLLNPDSNVPSEMSEALYYINEMSTPEGFDLIQETIENTDTDLNIADDVTCGDMALQVWLKDHELIKRLHAQQFLHIPRLFEYFKHTGKTLPVFNIPSDETVKLLEEDLNEWFVKKRRGRTSKVFVYERQNFVWFLIRHGEPLMRKAVIRNGESSSLSYRPEKYDVIIYNPDNGGIRISARSKGERELYRVKFGLHFFGNRDFFDGKTEFTLEPLRDSVKNSILCDDLEGMDWVCLKEIRIFRGGIHKEMEIHKSEDIFASMKENGYTIPDNGKLCKASFLIKFSDSRTPRTVTLSSGNRAQFRRDGDTEIIEKWMIRRGFISMDS